jgi:hypothetical protein
MALRSQKAIGSMILLSTVLAAADFPATHVHTRRDGPGVLTIDENGIAYKETDRHKKPHDYRWAWNDIQRLVLAPTAIEITTYKDIGWQFGRDREFSFRGKDFTPAYDLLRGRLQLRLIPEIALPVTSPLAEIPAKRLDGLKGCEGSLLIGDNQIVFKSDTPDGSHTWILPEVENISSSDPLELTIASLGTDYRIQLKQPLPEFVYNGLWRKLNTRRTHK